MTKEEEMLSVSDALSRLVGGFSVLDSEYVSLSNAHGRVLSENVEARLTQPPVNMSSMDGYAVKSSDVSCVPVRLRQVGVSKAGARFGGILGAGECVRIFTGAPLPDGANAVVIQEVTSQYGDQIEINKKKLEKLFRS